MKFLATYDAEPLNGGFILHDVYNHMHTYHHDKNIFDVKDEDAYAGDYVYADSEDEAIEEVASFLIESYTNLLTGFGISCETTPEVFKSGEVTGEFNGSATVTILGNGIPIGKLSIGVEEVEEEE